MTGDSKTRRRPPRAKAVRRLRRAVQKRNEELKLDAKLGFAAGLAISLVTFGSCFALVFLIMFFVSFGSTTLSLIIALAVTVILSLIAMRSAFHRVDVLDGIESKPDREQVTGLADVLMRKPHDLDQGREQIAGIAMLLLSGPESLVKARDDWRRQMSEDGETLAEAIDLLVACREGIGPEAVTTLEIGMMLRRLVLIRVVTINDLVRVEATDRGLQILGDLGKRPINIGADL